jgi:hypothetical protein
MIMRHRGSVCVPVKIVRFALYSRGEGVEAVVYVYICKMTPEGGMVGGKGVRVPDEGCFGFLNEPVVPFFHVQVLQDREGGMWEGETSVSEFC